jgi:hypothetical protein
LLKYKNAFLEKIAHLLNKRAILNSIGFGLSIIHTASIGGLHAALQFIKYF